MNGDCVHLNGSVGRKKEANRKELLKEEEQEEVKTEELTEGNWAEHHEWRIGMPSHFTKPFYRHFIPPKIIQYLLNA